MTPSGGSDTRPRLLDLFCGAGGAAMGYHRAGFTVVGIDIRPQPRYPFEFIQADALEFPLEGFDAIHASPPCQAYSATRRFFKKDHPELIPDVRARVVESGLPYIIENVVGAPLVDTVMVCGSSLGLDLRRHRLFESNVALMTPPCAHGWQTPRFPPSSNRHGLASVVNPFGTSSDVKEWRRAFEIDWMTRDEITQAIPPAYTEMLGAQLICSTIVEAAA